MSRLEIILLGFSILCATGWAYTFRHFQIVARATIIYKPLPEPVIQKLGMKNYQLFQPVEYKDWHHIIMIPAMFMYDRSSVPRLVWTFISPNDLSDLAPLLHDYLYRAGGKTGTVLPPRDYTRKEADGIFYDIMKVQGVTPWRSKAAYLAVRWLGWPAFKKK